MTGGTTTGATGGAAAGGTTTTGATGGTAGGASGGGTAAGGTAAGGTAVAGGTSVTFAQVSLFIRTQCGSCHAGQTPPNLDTTKGDASLYNTLTTATVRRCANNKLVTPNDPSKSALLMVGTGQCGTLKMPAGCTDSVCYSDEDQAMLTNWIRAGAKNP